MDKVQSDLRDYDPSTSSGKDVKDTDQISGQAKPTAAWKSKNSTTQYTTSGAGNSSGPLGGMSENK